jgi:hypothetical protein
MTKKWECLLADRLALKEELQGGKELVFINMVLKKIPVYMNRCA